MIENKIFKHNNWYKFSLDKEDVKGVFYILFDSYSEPREESLEIRVKKYIEVTIKNRSLKGEIHFQFSNSYPYQFNTVTFEEEKWINRCFLKKEVVDFEEYINSQSFKLEKIKDEIYSLLDLKY